MISKHPYVLTAAVLLLLAACSGSKKAFNRAKEYEEAGLYVEAAEQDLKALQDKPDFKEALVHLKTVAPKAYEELLDRGKKLETAENWDQTVREYQRLQSLLRRMQHHGVVLETVNVKERLRHAKQKAAAYHYANAESFFEKGTWQKAALAYLKAHDYVEDYNQSFDKAIQSYLNLGDQRLRNQKFAKALDAYRKILKIAPGHDEAHEKIAEGHYRWGRQLYDDGRYREAVKHFQTIPQYVTQYRDSQAWAQRAYDNAVQHVAVFPFENETPFEVDGYFITHGILNRAINANLEFADFLSYAETITLLDENRIRRYQPVNEAQLTQIARRKGLDSFVWGKVRDIVIKNRPESFKEYEYAKTVVVKDSAGNEIEETEPVFYREYTKSRRVQAVVQYVIVDTETGKYLDRQRFVEETNDQARWVAYQGSIYDLPKEKRRLLDAPRNPRPPPVLVNELLTSISKKISRDVIRFYR